MNALSASLHEASTFFVSILTSVLPTVLLLLTLFNGLVYYIGEDRIARFAKWSGRPGIAFAPIRCLLLPVVSVLILTNPLAYSAGAFLRERNKVAFYDAAVSFVHPATGIFPHANPAELFVWLGVANGVAALETRGALAPGFERELAVRYLIAGMIVILLRGIVTQLIFDLMARRRTRMFSGPNSESSS